VAAGDLHVVKLQLSALFTELKDGEKGEVSKLKRKNDKQVEKFFFLQKLAPYIDIVFFLNRLFNYLWS